MNRPYKIIDVLPYDQSWGLGVRVIPGKNYNYLPVGSFGWSGEYGTHFWCDPIGALLFLLSKDASGFINGVVIPVDGGFSAYSGV